MKVFFGKNKIFRLDFIVVIKLYIAMYLDKLILSFYIYLKIGNLLYLKN
jgi:hypothetical protein